MDVFLTLKAGLKTVPYEYKAAWKVESLDIVTQIPLRLYNVFTQGRPDVAEYGKPAGWAGDEVVLVTDEQYQIRCCS